MFIGIDGGWTAWEPCTKTCEGGIKTRNCTNPTPNKNGIYCIGDSLALCNQDIKCGEYFHLFHKSYGASEHIEIRERSRC